MISGAHGEFTRLEGFLIPSSAPNHAASRQVESFQLASLGLLISFLLRNRIQEISDKTRRHSSTDRTKKMADIPFATLGVRERSVCQALHPRRRGLWGPEHLFLLLLLFMIQ